MGLAGVLLLAACSPEVETTTSTPTSIVPIDVETTTTVVIEDPVLSEQAATYLDEALGAMRQHSINRDRVDWPVVEARAYRAADGAEVSADTYLAIRTALSELQDRHSRFFTPQEAGDDFSGHARYEEPTVEVRDGGLGYISISGYTGDIGGQADAYATELARRITAIEAQSCGWIIDLRHNTAGNMWPMIAGLGPVLGSGTVGSFTYPDGRSEPWEISDGVSLWDGAPMVSNGMDGDAPERRPTAVLIGGRTGSSGEAVTVAFHGADEARFFGYPTAGLTTANEPVYLSDGAILALTMSVFTDRTGLEYGIGKRVDPDETIGSFRTADGEEVVARAAEWLEEHPACGNL